MTLQRRQYYNNIHSINEGDEAPPTVTPPDTKGGTTTTIPWEDILSKDDAETVKKWLLYYQLRRAMIHWNLMP